MGVLDRHEVGVGAERALGGQFEHAGPERGQSAAPLGHGRVKTVKGVEVLGHVAVRPGIVLDDGRVTGAQAQKEPPGILGLQICHRAGDLLGIAGPDAHDPAGHHQV